MKRSKKTSVVKVDFSDVESRGSVPDNDYLLEVKEVEKRVSESSGNDYLAWTFKVAEGKHKGSTVWHNTSLQPQALWNLRNMLECMGIDTEEGVMELDLDEFVGQQVGATIENETYEGRSKPKVVAFISTDDLPEGEEEEEEEEEEKPKGKSGGGGKGKGKRKGKEEEEEEEEEEEGTATRSRTKKTPSKKNNPEFEDGQKVSFEDEGKTLTGKIMSIDGDVATVKVGKDEWEIGLDELTPL